MYVCMYIYIYIYIYTLYKHVNMSGTSKLVYKSRWSNWACYY